jgi:hypothetical protein
LPVVGEAAQHGTRCASRRGGWCQSAHAVASSTTPAERAVGQPWGAQPISTGAAAHLRSGSSARRGPGGGRARRLRLRGRGRPAPAMEFEWRHSKQDKSPFAVAGGWLDGSGATQQSSSRCCQDPPALPGSACRRTCARSAQQRHSQQWHALHASGNTQACAEARTTRSCTSAGKQAFKRGKHVHGAPEDIRNAV